MEHWQNKRIEDQYQLSSKLGMVSRVWTRWQNLKNRSLTTFKLTVCLFAASQLQNKNEVHFHAYHNNVSQNITSPIVPYY